MFMFVFKLQLKMIPRFLDETRATRTQTLLLTDVCLGSALLILIVADSHIYHTYQL